MKLRPYQQKAVEGIIEAWKKHRSCLIVLPTGCGKTVVFGEVIRRLLCGEIYTGDTTPRAMILAHRGELISQACDKVHAIANAKVDVEMGPIEAKWESDGWFPVIVSSVQTQITGRMRKFNPFDFSTLVIDEAHHARAKSYGACIEHYFRNPDCRLLGVTATPDRADQAALGKVFESVAYEYSVTEAIHDGWLVPVRQKLVQVQDLDFSNVGDSNGDLNQSELAEVLEEESNLHGIASPTLEICADKRAIVFATSVAQAERLAEIFNRSKESCAAWISGKTDKLKRKEILDNFRKGKTQFVVNVGVLTEGFDDAGVEIVVMARPTKSRALYAQMAGRATRPAAEIAARLGEIDESADAAKKRRELIAKSSKPNCLIVDFVGNSGRHKLISTLDILGGKEDDPDEAEVRQAVRKRCEELEDGGDVLEEIEEIREQIRQRKLAEAESRAFIKIKAKYVTTSVDPFDIYDMHLGQRDVASALDNRYRLTEKQLRILRERLDIPSHKIGPGREYSTLQARMILNEYFERVKHNLASFRQMRFMRKRGLCLPMSFQEASWTVEQLKRNGVRG